MTLWWGKNTCKWSQYLREGQGLGNNRPGWLHLRGGAVREVCAKVKGSWETTGWCWPGLPGTKTPKTSGRWFTPSSPTVFPEGNWGREQVGKGRKPNQFGEIQSSWGEIPDAAWSWERLRHKWHPGVCPALGQRMQGLCVFTGTGHWLKATLGASGSLQKGCNSKAQGASPEGHRWERSLEKQGDGCTVD